MGRVEDEWGSSAAAAAAAVLLTGAHYAHIKRKHIDRTQTHTHTMGPGAFTSPGTKYASIE